MSKYQEEVAYSIEGMSFTMPGIIFVGVEFFRHFS